jgi:hypothetical protein
MCLDHSCSLVKLRPTPQPPNLQITTILIITLCICNPRPTFVNNLWSWLNILGCLNSNVQVFLGCGQGCFTNKHYIHSGLLWRASSSSFLSLFEKETTMVCIRPCMGTLQEQHPNLLSQ